MSSWFSLSLPNPFKSDGDGEGPSSAADPKSSGDLSATLSQHLRAFPSSEQFSGIKNDLVEIGDSFKSGFSLFSSNKAVSEISKLASNFLHLGDHQNEAEDGDDDDEEEIVGITDEVVDFVTTISQRPQLWTDFPISLPTDFVMSDSQKEHVTSIEQFVPSLESLRQAVCRDLSDRQFWMIYFVLLLPRLNQNDLDLLSTPEIVEVRETLLQQLQSKKGSEPEVCESNDASEEDVKVSDQQGPESKLEKKSITGQDKGTLCSEEPKQQLKDEKTKNSTSYADKQGEDEEDVSFSDLEDDDNDVSSDRIVQGSKKVSSSSESHEWIQLNENSRAQGSQHKAGRSVQRDSEGEESSDWLTVDDIDLDSLAPN